MAQSSEGQSKSVPPLVSSEQKEKLLDDSDVARALNPSLTDTGKKGRLTLPLALAVVAVTLSSFQFGYHIGCVNAPKELIQQFFNSSNVDLFETTLTKEKLDLIWSVAVSIFAVGGMIGGLLSGWTADKFGRKGALLLNNLLAFIAAAFMALAKSVNVYPLFIVGRLIIGINCGLASGLVPMYLTEVSPVNLRGMLGSIHQLLVTIAILFSQILGLPFILGSPSLWPLILAFTVVPSILQLALLPFCPESPKYSLVVKNQAERAERDLKKLRASPDVVTELDAMKEEANAVQSVPKVGMLDMFGPSLRWPLSIAVMMMLSQQLSGINAAMFYSTAIFRGAGLTGNAPFYATIGMGTVNVIMTVISVYLVDHPRFGRRSLHLIGLSGMLVSTLLIVGSLSLFEAGKQAEGMPNTYQWSSYAAIVFVLLFVISFATGPGAIPWFFVSEIFASGARGNANSIAVMVNWTANLLVALAFLPINNAVGQYSFFVFSAFLVIFIIYTAKFVPETKGRTVEEINEEFAKQGRIKLRQ